MDIRKPTIPNTFNKEEGQGLLANYSDEDQSVGDALNKRLQKLAATKLQLAPETESPGSFTGG